MKDTRSFQKILRDQLVAQADLLETLTSHPTLIGAGRERAVMEMLRGQLPRRYEVLSGTILGEDEKGDWQKKNRQLDIMVVDTFDYPTLLRNGDIAVVLPEAVRVIIEVKSNLGSPPDPDRYLEKVRERAGKKKVSTGESEEGSLDEEGSPSGDEKRPEDTTFLGAISQAATNRSLFGEIAPLSILLSHKCPQGNKTLRGWLERVIRIQQGLRSIEKNNKDARYAAAMFELMDLPDFIIAAEGAFASRESDREKYQFIVMDRQDEDQGDKTRKENSVPAPGLITLVSRVVEYLDAQEPVRNLLMSDQAHAALQRSRDKAMDRFKNVMKPKMVPDSKNLPIKLLQDPVSEPDQGSPAPN